jgi:hypothetical protein
VAESNKQLKSLVEFVGGREQKTIQIIMQEWGSFYCLAVTL